MLTQTFSSIANTHLPSTSDEEPLLSRKLDPRQAIFIEHLLNQSSMLSHHFSSLGDHAVENAEGKIRNFVSSLKAAKVSVATLLICGSTDAVCKAVVPPRPRSHIQEDWRGVKTLPTIFVVGQPAR